MNSIDSYVSHCGSAHMVHIAQHQGMQGAFGLRPNQPRQSQPHQKVGEQFCHQDLANAWASKLNRNTKNLAWLRNIGVNPNERPW